VLDVQISAGWMHSGYPIMGHVHGSVDDLLELRQGGGGDHWGPFHELGHNFQYRPWVLPRTTETTCNLWSVYMYEKIGVSNAHSQMLPANQERKIDEYLATGPDFTEWSVWTALVTYMQLQEAFGWAFYTTIFTQYRESGVSLSTDAQKIDEWVRRSSLVAEVNLGPFYTAWGFPTSQSVLDEISSLPDWDDNPMLDQSRRRQLMFNGLHVTNSSASDSAGVSDAIAVQARFGGTVVDADGTLIAYSL
jgi:hypothetical protein